MSLLVEGYHKMYEQRKLQQKSLNPSVLNKWPPRHRLLFQKHLRAWKFGFWIRISLTILLVRDRLEKKISTGQVLAWSPTGDKPFRKPMLTQSTYAYTVYPKKYAHGFGVLCFVVVMQSFIMNSHEVFIHIHQGCFVGTGAIFRLPQCQWSKPDGYGKSSQCITTKHSKEKTVCIFLGIYCIQLGEMS